MQVIYPRPPSECPDYLHLGGDEWRDEVRVANEFGKKFEYNVGDTVDTITFYFPDSQTHRKNHVIIEKSTIVNINIVGSTNSYHVQLKNGCEKITTSDYLRPV